MKILPGDLVISTSLMFIYNDVKLYDEFMIFDSDAASANMIFYVISVVDDSLFVLNEKNSGWIHKNNADIYE
jgi:hypothetical protein